MRDIALPVSGTDAPFALADDLDRLLVEALVADARLSLRELAAKVGTSATTVGRRLSRFEEAGMVKGYKAIFEPEALGWRLGAIIGLQLSKGHLSEVQARIAKDPRVFGVYDVTGEWDGVVLARCRDRADLDDLAKTTLSQEHIERTYTMMVLRTIKEDAVASLPP